MGYLSPRQRDTLDAHETAGRPKLSNGRPANWTDVAVAAALRAATPSKPSPTLAEQLDAGTYRPRRITPPDPLPLPK